MINKIFQPSTTFAQENYQKMMKFKRSALAVAAMLPIGLLAGGANPTDAAVVGQPPTAAVAGPQDKRSPSDKDRPMLEAIAKDKPVTTVRPENMIKRPSRIMIPQHSRQGRVTEALPDLSSLSGREIDALLVEAKDAVFRWDQEVVAVQDSIARLTRLIEVDNTGYTPELIASLVTDRQTATRSLAKYRDAIVESNDKVRILENYKNTQAYLQKDNNREGVKVAVSAREGTVKNDTPALAQVTVTQNGEPAPGATVVIEQGVGNRKTWATATANGEGIVVFGIEKGTLGTNNIKVQAKVDSSPLVVVDETVEVYK